MPRVHLRVVLPVDRALTGHLTVEIDGVPVAEFDALGRGDRGPGQTSLREGGNTPTGEYVGTEYFDTSRRKRDSYGPWGAVRLKPVAGDALLAEGLGRTGLLIHGGSLGSAGYWRGEGALRATRGCLRLSNGNMQRLRDLLSQASEDPQARVCAWPEVRVTVREH